MSFVGRGYPRRGGFTLIEIMIVVVILAILAALVIPHYSLGAQSAKESAMREDLRYVRTQILIYNAEHGGQAPGPAVDDFVAQMTGFTDEDGDVGSEDATHHFGPYLDVLPANPLNGLDTIRLVGAGAFPAAAAGTHGWIYQPSTLTFASDAVGSDGSGKAYIDY